MKILLIVLVLLPMLAFALPANAAIVFCGTSANPDPCTVCDILKLVKNVIDYVTLTLTPIIAMLLILVSGVFVLLGGANPEMVTKGKKMLTNTLIGVAIIYGSFMIVNFILHSIAGNRNVATNWFKLDCQEVTPTPAPVTSGTPTPVASLCNDLKALGQKYNEPTTAKNAPETDKLYQCIVKNLTGKIFGSVFTIDLDNPICNITRGNPVCSATCSHAINSCHYGGESGNTGARAIDFGNENIGAEIIEAARNCGVPPDKARCEDAGGHRIGCSDPSATHVHVSTKSCDAK